MKKNFQFLNGTIKRHPDGFGFFIPEQTDHADVYIPRHSMKGAMTHDKVMVEVFPEKGSARFRGDIVKIISRGTKSIVGVYQRINDRSGMIKDEGKGWGDDLRIDTEHSMNAKTGQLVKADIVTYPEEEGKFIGKITQVIGDAQDPLTDIKRVLFQNNIPHEFPASVESEAKNFSEKVSEADMRGRKDLRSLNFITIDGATAKDFDDAIYIEANDRGFLLYVAIADVSHYVRPGSAIDKEALTRGTSVYFPNFVVPMLPEVLSNGLCSLNPHVPRLSLVAEMQMDFTGQIIESKFYEAVIESKARVTYGEAQEVIEGTEVQKLKHVSKDILLAADLAKILMAKRFREGSLDLEIPEVQIVIDSAGLPVDFIKSERLFAHRLIEEMMLSANVAVAKFLSDAEIPAIYRIHESPNETALEILEGYLNRFGSRVDMHAGMLQKRLTKALQEFEGKPEAQVLNILALRSMSQAKYSPNNVGHFGLGFQFYTHFTSPIRRYPDLIVHRLVKSLVMQGSAYKAMTEEDLASDATMLSAAEQRSVKAERQFQSIKKARFMSKFLGEEFEGIISSVTKFGVFVLLRAYEVDGLIRMENLSKEKLEFDEENLVLFGRKTGQAFSIGDVVKIQVAGADAEAGQVDFDLVEVISAGASDYQPPARSDRDDGPSKRKSGHGGERSGGKKSRSEKFQDRHPGGRHASGRNTDAKHSKSKRDDRKEFGNRGKEKPPRRDDRKDERPKRKSPFHEKPVAPKSKKLRAVEAMEEKVIEFLNDANEKTQDSGQKFDPEAHLQKALAKWKARNGDTTIERRSGQDRREGDDRRRDDSSSGGNVKIGFRGKSGSINAKSSKSKPFKGKGKRR